MALSQSLAAGAAALQAGSAARQLEGVAGPAGVARPAEGAAGSAVLRGATAPAIRNVRESLGDQPVAGGQATGPSGSGAAGAAGGPRPGYTPSGARIGRNDPCWCGSGNKYKKCHGR